MSTTIDFDAIKVRHPLAEYCRQRGIELHRNGASGELIALCPLHKEKTPSFHVYPDNHYHCYGCEAHGDVTDLEQAFGGGTRVEAAHRLGAERRENIDRLSKTEPDKPKGVYQLTKADRELMLGACATLRESPELALEVREELPLNVVREIAIQGDLGFCRELSFNGVSGPALLFGYSHGIKARWPGRIFRWWCGNMAGECWRQSSLLKAHQTIYFTEGETDTLSLVEQGYEVSGKSLIVGLASASNLPDPEPFALRDLVLIPDTDDAGNRCAERFQTIFGPVAHSIAIVDLRPEGVE